LPFQLGLLPRFVIDGGVSARMLGLRIRIWNPTVFAESGEYHAEETNAFY